MSSVSRRGWQFVRRASLGGLVAASLCGAGEAMAQITIPPNATGTAGDAAGSSSFGSQSITMNGGTLTLNATRTANQLHERLFNGSFANININPLDPSNPSSFFNLNPVFAGELTTELLYPNGAAFDSRAGISGLTDTVGGLWFGEITVGGPNLAAGNVIFATNSDDGSNIFVDRNQDGVFGANEWIVNNQDTHGQRRRAANINLAAGAYKVAIGFFEVGGGEFMEARFDTGTAPNQTPANTTNVATGTYNGWNIIDPSSPSQAGIWGTAANDPNFSTNNVTVTADSTIAVDVGPFGSTRLGALSISPGVTLTTTGGRLSAGPLTTTGGTVTKAGSGQLAIAAGSGVAAGTTIDIREGTLGVTNNSTGVTSINAAPITLSGGTLAVDGVQASVGKSIPGWLGQFYYAPIGSDEVFEPGTGLDALSPVATAIAPAVNFPSVGDPSHPFTSLGVVLNTNDHASRFTGKINITTAGNYQFSTESDDGSVMWIDLNNDGDFLDAGEEIVDNRGLHGMRQITSADVPLTAGQFTVKVEHFERGGGSGIIARFGQSGTPLQVIPQSVVSTTIPDYQSNISVNENSTITSSGLVPQFGDLNITAGKTLNLSGGGARFDNVNLPAGTVTITTTANVPIGRLSDGANTGAVLTKAGSGTLVLDDATSDIDGTTINVQAGTLSVKNTSTGGNPLGASTVQLSGGTLMLDTTPFPLTGVSVVGTYTGRFYNLAAGSGSDASFDLLDTLTPVETVTTIAEINFPSSGANPFQGVMADPAALQVDDHASRFTGRINVTAAQNISFFTNSDDGSILWVDLNNDGDFVDASEEVVDNRGLHGMLVRTGSRFLPAGNYNVRVDQFERGGGSGIIAGFQGLPEFNNNINVTATSTLNVGGSAGGATVGNISLSAGVTLTKTGSPLTAGNLTLGGSGTINNSGNITVASISDGTNSGTFTHTGPATAPGTLTVTGAGDLSGTTLNVVAGTINAVGANSLANAPAINLSGGGALRVGHADAVSSTTPLSVGRISYVDFDVSLTSGRKITVEPFGAVVGQLDNLSYGSGANQVGLVDNSILAPDVGETNLPAPLPAGSRMLFGLTANNQTVTHGGETSTGPTDLYRGVAIGGWTQPGPLAANLSGPGGGDLNIHIVAPTGLLPGNLTFKNINPAATQFNTSTGVVNVLGQGRLIINAGGDIGGTWTTMNRTGDPNFFGANNVILELAGGNPPAQIGATKTVNIRHGSLNLPGGGGANAAAVEGTVNILEGGTLILDDNAANSPQSGVFNIAGAVGTRITDFAGAVVPGIGPSTGAGAIYTNQANQNQLGGATFNVGPGFLLVLDNDNATVGATQDIIHKADIVLDADDDDTFTAGIILGQGRRLTTPSSRNVDINDEGATQILSADPIIVGTPAGRVLLTAADGRQLDINDRQANFSGVDLQIGDANSFTTTEGNAGRGFADIRVGRVTVPQTGRVKLAGVAARNVIVRGGRVEFEDDANPVLDAGGNFIVEEGTLFVNNNGNLMTALQDGNFGLAGAQIRLHDGGAFYPEFDRGAARTVTQAIRTVEAGKSYLVLDQGGGTGDADVHFNNVALANGSTIDLGFNGGNTILRATINATAGNGAIENNGSDANVRVTVNAGSQPITFTGSRLTQLEAPVIASQIRIGDGATRSGRLSIANLAHVGSTPITVSPFSHLAFNPGTGSTVTPNLANITQGSGTLRAQSGTVDFGTSVLSGGTVAPITVAGLQHSVLPGSANLTEPNANTDVQLGTLAATTPNLEGTFGTFGQVNSTHVYAGEFFDADGIVAFAEHFDDRVLLRIDGRTVLDNGAFNVPTTSPDDDANTPGLQTNIGPGNGGWHTFELRLGQGTGGVGAPGTQGGVTWPFGTFGFGFNPDPGTSITGATQQSNYQPMLDNGSMNLFRSVIDPGAGDLFVDADATMRMGGFTNQDSLTLNGSASATASLTLTSTTGTNTLLRTSVNGLGAIDNAAGSTVDAGALTTANNATLTKLGGGTLNVTGAQSHGTGTTLTVSAGSANVNTDAGSASARRLTVNANSATNFGSSQHLAALNVGAGATATLTAGGAKNLVTGGLTIAGGAAPTGTLNVTDNAVIVDFPAAGPNPAADIRSQIISGRGGTDLLGTWTGQGITSSLAAADPGSVSVGFAVNADLPLGPYTNFRGETVDPTAVIIRGTRNADANLDGVVGDDDVTIVGATFGMTTGATWALGDFTYDGAVNDDDVTLLGALYDPSAPPLGGAVAVATGVAAVPEPASWLMMALGGLGAGLFGWRWRRKV